MTSRYRIWSLLVRILFESNSPESNLALRSKLIPHESFWQEVISLSNANLVTSALWNILHQKGFEDRVSPDALEYLESFNDLNLGVNRSIRDQALECIGSLNEAGLVPMPIKGVAYQLAATGEDVLDRYLTDIDIMVPDDTAELAQKILHKAGYRIIPSKIVDYGVHHHLAPMWRKGSPVTIEIHRNAAPGRLTSALPSANIWRNSSLESLDGTQFRLPGPTDSAMMVFLHNVLIDRCFSLFLTPLRSFLDADRLQFLYGRAIDWDHNLVRISEIGARPAFRRFASTIFKLSGRKIVEDIHFSLTDHLHFQLCHRAAAQPALTNWALRFDRLSEHQLRKSYGVGEGSLSLYAYRIKEIGAMMLRGIKTTG